MSDHFDLNERWCAWLNDLNPQARRAVLDDELFYFDAVKNGSMTTAEVLTHVRERFYATV